jgi:RNA polymerase sigma-70 factor (ECF subfamily)
MTTNREERFTQLVLAHGDVLSRYFQRRHHDADAVSVDDLLAEVLAVAWRRFDDLPEDAELLFLYGIARNVLANTRRRSGRRAAITSRLRPVAPSPSAELEAIGDLTVRAALADLAPTDREILLLSAFEGCGPSECATVLGISTNAAAIRLSRAKQHFAERLHAADPESSSVDATGVK